jgi:tripartite-type tricarboxylate transporter receptor subunit TctC
LFGRCHVITTSGRNFAPVILLAKLPLIMSVTATLPAQSIADVISLAKARPGQLAFASSGTGGAPRRVFPLPEVEQPS